MVLINPLRASEVHRMRKRPEEVDRTCVTVGQGEDMEVVS